MSTALAEEILSLPPSRLTSAAILPTASASPAAHPSGISSVTVSTCAASPPYPSPTAMTLGYLVPSDGAKAMTSGAEEETRRW